MRTSIERIIMARSKQNTPHQDKSSEDNARIEIRTKRENKDILERVASLSGQSLSSYIMAVCMHDARQRISDYSATELTLRDWKIFQDIITHPDPPNAKLKKAAKEYMEWRTASNEG